MTGAPAIAGVADFGMASLHPNPFTTGTEVVFGLDRPARARLEVFDVVGHRIATVVDRQLPAGRHAFAWEGTNSAGRPVASGMYFVRLTSGDRSDLKRVVRLR